MALSPGLFDYTLPSTHIAQRPLPKRHASRMLVVKRGTRYVEDSHFQTLPQRLPPRSLLVFNNTQVLPWRLRGRLPSGGKIEALLVEKRGEGCFGALVKKGRRLKPGMEVVFGEGELPARVGEPLEEGRWALHFVEPDTLEKRLETHGLAPLPPYIRPGEGAEEEQAHRRHYQTCYAKVPGAIAAPTAGLHFSAEAFKALEEAEIEQAWVTLHVGLGTFRPIQESDATRHQMHREWFHLPAATAQAIFRAKAEGRAVIAVGTTTVRTLETWALAGQNPAGETGWSELFIYPPFSFQVVEGMLTNFHQPKSTLMMLVSAFHGREALLAAYQKAIEAGYRFFSYGDCMSILPAQE